MFERRDLSQESRSEPTCWHSCSYPLLVARRPLSWRAIESVRVRREDPEFTYDGATFDEHQSVGKGPVLSFVAEWHLDPVRRGTGELVDVEVKDVEFCAAFLMRASRDLTETVRAHRVAVFLARLRRGKRDSLSFVHGPS